MSPSEIETKVKEIICNQLEVSLEQAPPKADLEVNEEREVELRYLRLDVKNFPEKVTMADLARLPPSLLEQTWLFDLDAGPPKEGAIGRPPRMSA